MPIGGAHLRVYPNIKLELVNMREGFPARFLCFQSFYEHARFGAPGKEFAQFREKDMNITFYIYRNKKSIIDKKNKYLVAATLKYPVVYLSSYKY